MSGARAVLEWLRRARSSVRLRVTMLAAGVFAITVAVTAPLLLNSLEHRLVGDIRRADQASLVQQRDVVLSDGVPANAVDVDQSVVSGHSAPLQVVQYVSMSGQPFVLTLPKGVPVDDVLTDTNAPAAGVAMAAAVGTFEQSLGPVDRLSVSSMPVGAALLSTASPLDEVRDTLHTTTRLLWVIGPILVAFVGGLSWLLAGRALRPVRLVTSRVAAIESSSLHERVPVPSSSDEIAVLARTMNQMLERLDIANTASRRLVSDASHELRTPVAVMRTELEVARRATSNDWDATGEVLSSELDRLQGLIDDLLLLARGDERVLELRDVDLVDIVHDVASRRRRVDVEVSMPGGHASCVVSGDADAVGRALDHLVSNAARSAATRVMVSVACEADDIEVGVDDDGPGIPEEVRELVVQRFVRLDESRGRGDGGAGLGLAVAADVARAHHGRLVIGESPLGGARVSLLFPCSTSPQP